MNRVFTTSAAEISTKTLNDTTVFTGFCHIRNIKKENIQTVTYRFIQKMRLIHVYEEC